MSKIVHFLIVLLLALTPVSSSGPAIPQADSQLETRNVPFAPHALSIVEGEALAVRPDAGFAQLPVSVPVFDEAALLSGHAPETSFAVPPVVLERFLSFQRHPNVGNFRDFLPGVLAERELQIRLPSWLEEALAPDAESLPTSISICRVRNGVSKFAAQVDVLRAGDVLTLTSRQDLRGAAKAPRKPSMKTVRMPSEEGFAIALSQTYTLDYQTLPGEVRQELSARSLFIQMATLMHLTSFRSDRQWPVEFAATLQNAGRFAAYCVPRWIQAEVLLQDWHISSSDRGGLILSYAEGLARSGNLPELLSPKNKSDPRRARDWKLPRLEVLLNDLPSTFWDAGPVFSVPLEKILRAIDAGAPFVKRTLSKRFGDIIPELRSASHQALQMISGYPFVDIDEKAMETSA